MNEYMEPDFENYGQFGPGMLDIRVFDQGKVWVDYSGSPHDLSTMPQDYVDNVVSFLLHRADELHEAYRARALTLRVMGALTTSQDPLRQSLDLTFEEDPFEWLESTPLMRAFRQAHPSCPELGDLLVSSLRGSMKLGEQ